VAASGLAGLGSAGASAFATAGAGAAAGSFIPVVGTLIGVGVGLTVGIFAGKHSKQKQQNKIIALQKEILQNQNTIINSLKKQLQELEEKYRETVKNNERYKYLLSLLMVNNELVSALEGV
jgi:phage tail tape-measure protein